MHSLPTELLLTLWYEEAVTFKKISPKVVCMELVA